MANQPPAGRWTRMATLRPMSNPTQDPPQPPAPRSVLGRTFTAVPFRPAVPTAPAPPRQATPTPTLPAVPAIRPASVRLAGTSGIPPPPQGTPNIISPQRAAATNGVPPQQWTPNEVTTNGVPSSQGAPNAARTNGAPSLQSPLRAPAALMPDVKPSPQPAQPTALKAQAAPTASPVGQRSPMISGNGAQQLLSPRANSPPAPLTGTNITSPVSKAPYTPQFYTPRSPSLQSPPQQPSLAYRSPTASPSPQKQAASPPNFTSTTPAPAPRSISFSDVQTFSSPTKTQVSPAASTPRIPSPNTFSPPDRTPPHSPKTMSMAPPPSPLQLPPPQLHFHTEQDSKIPQEPEQKSVLFQQTSEKHNKPSPIQHSNNKPHTDSIPNLKSPEITKHEHHIKHPHHKKHPDSEHINRSTITIAGENRGALMNLTRPRTTQFPGHPHKLTSPNSSAESSESSGWSKPKPRDAAAAAAAKSFTNSNVQGINNSIMFNSIVTHHDPGVHVAFSRRHKGHGGLGHYKEPTDGHQS